MLYTHENRHTEHYAEMELPAFPREPTHPWLHNNRNMINNPVSIRAYAAAVSGMDDGVGAILDGLTGRGLDENTLVVFTADQGWCGGHHGMWGMGDHSRPIHTYEESVRIPLIYRHTGRIPAGSVIDRRTCNYNVFPTLLDHLGLSASTPQGLPGSSHAAALTGGTPDWNESVFFEYENTRMVRTDRWKFTWRHPRGPDELYDMQADPGERHNLADVPAYAMTREDLRSEIATFFDRHADPEFDVWKGGRSKAGRLVRG
jgi:arylsulfatase A-like enzyme